MKKFNRYIEPGTLVRGVNTKKIGIIVKCEDLFGLWECKVFYQDGLSSANSCYLEKVELPKKKLKAFGPTGKSESFSNFTDFVNYYDFKSDI